MAGGISMTKKMRWIDRFCVASIGTLTVIVGVYFGHKYLERQYHHNQQEQAGLVTAFAAWDGWWYEGIATTGYRYEKDRPSSIVFFPAYPKTAGLVSLIVPVSARVSLLVISNVCLIAVCLLLGRYVASDSQLDGDGQESLSFYAILCCSLFPATLFHRMAYSESMFLLVVLLAMYGMQRHWPTIAIAALIGLATATRTVGIALLLPFAFHISQQSDRWPTRIMKFMLYLPVAIWGLCVYMAYLHVTHGDALAFAANQKIWAIRPEIDIWEKLTTLITLEPLWSVYLPFDRAYWQTAEFRSTSAVFSVYFWNPIVFVAFVILSILGYARNWINSKEFLLCVGLLGIPYLTQAYETMMRSQARYCTAAFPVYIVMAQLARRAPKSLTTAFLLLSSLFLCIFSMLFASWHRVI
jgi:hypothetical protein